MPADLKRIQGRDSEHEIAGFLRMESLSPQRTKDEKIAALRALGGYLDDAATVSFLKQESLSAQRSLEEKLAIFQALGTGF